MLPSVFLLWAPTCRCCHHLMCRRVPTVALRFLRSKASPDHLHLAHSSRSVHSAVLSCPPTCSLWTLLGASSVATPRIRFQPTPAHLSSAQLRAPYLASCPSGQDPFHNGAGPLELNAFDLPPKENKVVVVFFLLGTVLSLVAMHPISFSPVQSSQPLQVLP